jgi:hypothetical protein
VGSPAVGQRSMRLSSIWTSSSRRQLILRAVARGAQIGPDDRYPFVQGQVPTRAATIRVAASQWRFFFGVGPQITDNNVVDLSLGDTVRHAIDTADLTHANSHGVHVNGAGDIADAVRRLDVNGMWRYRKAGTNLVEPVAVGGVLGCGWRC